MISPLFLRFVYSTTEMVELQAQDQIANTQGLAIAIFKIENINRSLFKANYLQSALLALVFLVYISTSALAQSATGRPEKTKPPVKPNATKRSLPTVQNKTSNPNPEDKTTQQPAETKPATQTNEVKPQTPEPRPVPKVNEPKLSVPLTQLKQALNCVGLIMVRNKGDASEQPVPRGSGVIISKDGIIATNYHVVREDNQDRLFDEITFSLPEVGMPATSVAAKRFIVQVVQKSKDNDLALLKIIADQTGKPLDKNTVFQTVDFGDSSKVELMDTLVIIGFPATGGLTVTTNAGIVQGKDLMENWIKTDARLLHGNSGGAAIDDKGRLIGIPTKVEVDRPLVKKASPNNYSKDIEEVYAIGYLRPANLIAKMLETLRYHESKPTNINSIVGSNTASEGPRDIIVRGVLKSTPDGLLIAGAIVGLVSVDSEEITVESIISYGKTNGEGKFELSPPVAAGKYKLRVKATGFALLTKEIEISEKQEPIVIEIKKTQ